MSLWGCLLFAVCCLLLSLAVDNEGKIIDVDVFVVCRGCCSSIEAYGKADINTFDTGQSIERSKRDEPAFTFQVSLPLLPLEEVVEKSTGANRC